MLERRGVGEKGVLLEKKSVIENGWREGMEMMCAFSLFLLARARIET